jgi:polysaccharide export outer membrane protein
MLRARPFRSLASVSLMALLLAGCLPISGPRGTEILNGPVRPEALATPYQLFNANAAVVEALRSRGETDLAGAFTDRRPAPASNIGVGDVVGITIFEAAAGGLFIPEQAGARPGNFITLPDQTVGRDGTVSVPFAGLIRAANRPAGEVQAEIERRLRQRAIEPQVVLAVRDVRSNLVTLISVSGGSQRFSPSAGGERILDAVARAGGPGSQGHDARITLVREGRTASVNFNTLIRSPSNNVFVRGGDIITISRENRSVLAFGASGQNGTVRFDQERMTMADALARAGGILDERAEPSYVFLYRQEPRRFVEDLRGSPLPDGFGSSVPTVYRFDLRDPSGYFLAQQVAMRDRDVIFVGNADGVEWAKFLQFLRLNLATVNEGIGTRNSIRSLSNN